MFFQRKHESELERKLRRRRPRADEGLVDEIASRIEGHQPAPRPHSLRVAFAVASVGIVAALAALGGASYAASSAQHAAAAVKHVFVAKQAAPAKPTPSADVLNALQPGKTSAADQYLPPGVTPVQAIAAFLAYVVKANNDLQAKLDCSAKTGRAKVACLARVRALNALKARNTAALTALSTQIGALPADKQARVGTLLAIQLQQQQKLATGQSTRQTQCASATYKAAHKAICAKVNSTVEPFERLRLGLLELAEIQAFMTALGP